ncbi:KilA-N domain-containing protein [Corallococcus exercitus]|uniref:KilA-N domain-containing protein n=1 Tax=Corallococcus exercitus TaxID=2316736 RepID=UPI0035D40B85
MTDSKKSRSIVVQGTVVSITSRGEKDYISLTDMVKRFGDETVLYAWLRNRNTVEFLGIWEQIHNQDFNPLEFERFRSEAGLNSFSLSPSKWVQATGAIGIYSKAGRGGGTYAHRDIAFEFGSWLSPEFKLYLIKEFQRLKDDEAEQLSREWSFQRTLAKVNYRIHTDAIQEHLIPPTLTKAQIQFVYASEADLLNVALFGKTAAEWRKENPKLAGNMRDHAPLEQLVVLSNLESLNSVLIHQGLPASERLRQLNAIAIVQVRSLLSSTAVKRLTPGKK